DHVVTGAVGEGHVHRRSAVARDELRAVRRYVPQPVRERVVIDAFAQVRAPGPVAEQSFGIRVTEIADASGPDVALVVAVDPRLETRGIGALHPNRQLRLLAGILAQPRQGVVIDPGSDSSRAR